MKHTSFDELTSRLDALIMVLKSCKGKSCIDPWSVLHPQGDIKTLKDAMHKSLNAFYEKQTRVRFDACELGYIRESEGPQLPNIFGDSDDYGSQHVREPLQSQPQWYRGHWSWYT